MKYEYYCQPCNLVTEVTCSMKDTTPSIECPQCKKEALKNMSAQVGAAAAPIYYESNFFLLRPGSHTWHIPTPDIAKKNAHLKTYAGTK